MKTLKTLRIVAIIASMIPLFIAACWGIDAVYEWADIDIAAHAVVRAFVWLLISSPFLVATEGLGLAISSIEDRQRGMQMVCWQQHQENERITKEQEELHELDW